MGTENSKAVNYQVPFNIRVCDITDNNPNSTALMKLVLGEQYLTLPTKKLGSDDISYIHPQWQWLFTPTAFNQLSTQLEFYFSQRNPETENTMFLFKTESISNSRKMIDLFNQIQKIFDYRSWMTVIITNAKDETKETLHEVMKDILIDKLLFHLINNPENNDTLKKMIYCKLYAICSYYNELGDQYIFSDNLEKREQAKAFNQRINILLLGTSGCGKSTFINTILGENRCKAGNGGMPMTSKIVQYHHSLFPLSFFDTPGFESDPDINNAINLIKKSLKLKGQQIHLILYLFNSHCGIILDIDRKLLQWKGEDFQSTPLVFLATKAQTIFCRQSTKEILKRELQNLGYSFHHEGIIPIEMPNVHQKNHPFGLKELMEWLYHLFSQYTVSDAVKAKYFCVETEEDIYSLNQSIYFLSHITSKEVLKQLDKSIKVDSVFEVIDRCVKAIDNYNLAIESFNLLKTHFEEKERISKMRMNYFFEEE